MFDRESGRLGLEQRARDGDELAGVERLRDVRLEPDAQRRRAVRRAGERRERDRRYAAALLRRQLADSTDEPSSPGMAMSEINRSGAVVFTTSNASGADAADCTEAP
ncbi:MAG: hypothetical protein U0414_44350 [Polyangiaceae bacterium]